MSMPLRTLMPLVGIAALLVGLVIHFLTGIVTPEGDTLAAATVYHGNIFIGVFGALLLIVLAGALLGNTIPILSHPVLRASLVPVALLAMLAYHIALAPIWRPSGLEQLALLLLFYIVPTGYLSWWLAIAPHGKLTMRSVPLVMLPGVAYIAYLFFCMLGDIPTTMMEIVGWDMNTLGNNAMAGLVAVFGLAVAAVSFDGIVGGVVARRNDHSTHSHA